MILSQSIAPGIARHPTKLIGFLVRAAWAILVLLGVMVLWLALFLLFLPFLLLSLILHRHNEPADHETESFVHSGRRLEASTELIFDRRQDVSKLIGCNTRNVKYRWQLFSAHLLALKARFDHTRAIDFGAGSLRDSYELSKQGHEVVAVDLEEDTIKRYFESYDWQSCPSSPRLFTHGLATLSEQEPDRSFHLVIAFDVLEHLENPETYLRRFQRLLHPDGYLFSIVPNKRSIFETYFRRSLRRQRSKGAVVKPGVPHLQFKTPTEWARFFEANGFKIIEHDMAIGFLVNDCWNGLLGLPIRTHVSPVIELLAHRLHVNANTAALESAFSPAWLMEQVNHWDELLKPQLKHRFGWNLIVAQPVAVDSTEA